MNVLPSQGASARSWRFTKAVMASLVHKLVVTPEELTAHRLMALQESIRTKGAAVKAGKRTTKKT